MNILILVLDNNATYKYRIKAFTFNDVESAPTATLGKTKALPKMFQILCIKIIFLKNQYTWNASPTSDIIVMRFIEVHIVY